MLHIFTLEYITIFTIIYFDQYDNYISQTCLLTTSPYCEIVCFDNVLGFKMTSKGLCSSIHKNISKSVFLFYDVTITNWYHKFTDCRVISKQCHYGESKIRGLMLFESNPIEISFV